MASLSLVTIPVFDQFKERFRTLPQIMVSPRSTWDEILDKNDRVFQDHQEDISTVKRAFVEGEITLILARDIYRLLLRREKHHDDLITGSWEAKILLVIPVYLHEIRLARWKWDEEHAWRMEMQTRAHASRMRRIELGGQWI